MFCANVRNNVHTPDMSSPLTNKEAEDITSEKNYWSVIERIKYAGKWPGIKLLICPDGHIGRGALKPYSSASLKQWDRGFRSQYGPSYVSIFSCASAGLTHLLCGIVVRVSGCRSRGPGLNSRPYQIFWKVWGLERGPLGLMRTIEELLEWKSSGSGLENRD
jgi:hypothetical protein